MSASRSLPSITGAWPSVVYLEYCRFLLNRTEPSVTKFEVIYCGSAELSCSFGSVFVSGQPTSVLKNRPREKILPRVVYVTVGKLPSVDVHVTSTVLTELGIHEPTSVFKLCRGRSYVTSVWCCYITVLGL